MEASPSAKRQRRSASAATVGEVDVQAVAESIADCCETRSYESESCRRAVQAVLDGETSTLDLEGLSLRELPHALLQLRVDAVLADTERLPAEEASLLRGLGEPGGGEAVSAYLKERAARRLQLLGDIDAAQAEALEGMTEGRAAARVRAVLRGESATLRLAGLRLSDLPAAIGQPRSLRLLDLRGNKLSALLAGLGLPDLPVAAGQLQSLKVLDLSSNQLAELPEAVGSLTALEQLYVSGNKLRRLPAALGQLQSLTELDLSNNQLSELPAVVCTLAALEQLHVGNNQLMLNPSDNKLTELAALEKLYVLKVLHLDSNQLTELPEAVCWLAALEQLRVGENQLTRLPTALGQLQSLEVLYLGNNQLTELPEAVGSLAALEHLYVGNNELTCLPAAVGQLRSLKLLDLSSNDLTELPAAIGQLQSLKELDLSRNRLRELPEAVGSLAALEVLNVTGNRLSALPEALGSLAALSGLHVSNNQLGCLPVAVGQLQSLKLLDLSGNQLTELPAAIGQLRSLKELDLSGNQLTELPEAVYSLASLELPEAVCSLAALEKLNVSHNELTCLPAAVGQLQSLKELDLSHNKLTELPEAVCLLVALEQLYLSNNALTRLPAAIEHLSSLRKLELAGNPLQLPPLAVLPENAATAARRFFRDLRTHGREQSSSGKLVLLGAANAGKTSLLRGLQHGKPRPTAEPDRTIQLALSALTIRRSYESFVHLSCWDFGGQHEAYAAVQQPYIVPGALYLLVVPADRASDEHRQEVLGQWLDMLQTRAPGAAVQLVLTRVDKLVGAGVVVGALALAQLRRSLRSPDGRRSREAPPTREGRRSPSGAGGGSGEGSSAGYEESEEEESEEEESEEEESEERRRARRRRRWQNIGYGCLEFLDEATADAVCWLRDTVDNHRKAHLERHASSSAAPEPLRVLDTVLRVSSVEGGKATLTAADDRLSLITAPPGAPSLPLLGGGEVATPLPSSLGQVIPANWLPAMALPAALRDGRDPAAAARALQAKEAPPSPACERRPYIPMADLQSQWQALAASLGAAPDGQTLESAVALLEAQGELFCSCGVVYLDPAFVTELIKPLVDHRLTGEGGGLDNVFVEPRVREHVRATQATDQQAASSLLEWLRMLVEHGELVESLLPFLWRDVALRQQDYAAAVQMLCESAVLIELRRGGREGRWVMPTRLSAAPPPELARQWPAQPPEGVAQVKLSFDLRSSLLPPGSVERSVAAVMQLGCPGSQVCWREGALAYIPDLNADLLLQLERAGEGAAAAGGVGSRLVVKVREAKMLLQREGGKVQVSEGCVALLSDIVAGVGLVFEDFPGLQYDVVLAGFCCGAAEPRPWSSLLSGKLQRCRQCPSSFGLLLPAAASSLAPPPRRSGSGGGGFGGDASAPSLGASAGGSAGVRSALSVDCALLVMACSPDVSPLANVIDEASQVSRQIPAAICRGGTANDLAAELAKQKPRYFLFSGHADASLGMLGNRAGEKTLCFTQPGGGAEAVEADVVASTLGRYAAGGGGRLELVFLNGCDSYDLGAKVAYTHRVPYVVCWQTKVKDGAARVFAVEFFSELRRGGDVPRAFEMAKDAVQRETAPGQLASGQAAAVTQYVLCHPSRPLPAPKVAAGIPVLVTQEGERT